MNNLVTFGCIFNLSSRTHKSTPSFQKFDPILLSENTARGYIASGQYTIAWQWSG